MTGTLYLIPNTLGDTEALSHVIPEHVQAITARLDYFVAENAKTARAFLKLIDAQHTLAKPLQEITIAELNVNTPAQALAACWRRCWPAATPAWYRKRACRRWPIPAPTWYGWRTSMASRSSRWLDRRRCCWPSWRAA